MATSTENPLDVVAKAVFLAALHEDRCGELLGALFDGATCTVDPVTGKLVIMYLPDSNG